jgi:glycerophosphoryl diester phosphodiesterase
MRILIYCLIVITLFSCTKADSEIYNLHGGRIFVIGHGGAGFETYNNYLPENSITSIDRCIVVYNSDGVEVDVQLSRDNQLILFHDIKLESQTSCTGCIRDNNSDFLLDCRYTKNFTTSVLTEEKLVSLEQVLSRYSQRNPRPRIFLDTRLFISCIENENINNYMEDFSEAILYLVNKYNYREEIYIESPSVEFLKLIQSKDPGLKYLIDSSDFDTMIDSATINNFYGLVGDNKIISKNDVKRAHDKNLNVVIFNMRSRNSTVEAVNKHPDYIQTDEILLLQQILMNK